MPFDREPAHRPAHRPQPPASSMEPPKRSEFNCIQQPSLQPLCSYFHPLSFSSFSLIRRSSSLSFPRQLFLYLAVYIDSISAPVYRHVVTQEGLIEGMGWLMQTM